MLSADKNGVNVAEVGIGTNPKAILTGVGFNFTTLVVQFSGQQAIMGLLLVMVACIILGTGLPTTVAYIVVAAIGGPALIKLGIPPMAAHMFAFYYAVISMVTPLPLRVCRG